MNGLFRDEESNEEPKYNYMNNSRLKWDYDYERIIDKELVDNNNSCKNSLSKTICQTTFYIYGKLNRTIQENLSFSLID